MNSIKINTGEIKLAINNDDSRIIEFNPEDLSFVENFYAVICEFENKEKEYKQRASLLEEDTELNSFGVPKNTKKVLELTREICEYMRNQIDTLFGEGTSDKAFGNANTLDMFNQFFDGVSPYIQKSRTEKVEKYTKNRAQRRSSSKVMT